MSDFHPVIENFYVRPEAAQDISFVKVGFGESTMMVPEDIWAEYIDAWFKYQNAVDKLQTSLVNVPFPTQPFETS